MLFNKDNNGSQELYELTGSFYASTSFRSIASEVDHATKEVERLVGPEIIKKAEEEYMSGNMEDTAFLNAVRMPIAVLAVANFTRQNIVSHEDTGSKIKVDDNEKVPFEWMIDRDNREQRERYYRSLDALYAFLIAGDYEWKGKAAAGKCIVPGLAEFESVYPLNGSYYAFYMFQPLLMDIQRRKLQTFISEKDIEAAIAEPGSALAAAMREFVVLGALIKGVKRWSVAMFPLEVARSFSPSYQGNNETSAATIKEIEWFIGKMEEQMAEAEKEVLKLAPGATNPYEGFPLLPKNDPRNKYFTV